MPFYSYLTLTANGFSGTVQVYCGEVISFVCRSSSSVQSGDQIVLYKGGSGDKALARSTIPHDLYYKVSDAGSGDTSWYTCHDETGLANDDRVYVSVSSCLDTDVPNPIILWSCIAVAILVIAVLASLISYVRMMKRSRDRSTRTADQTSATSTTRPTNSQNITSDHFNLSLPTVSSGDVRQSRWSAVAGRLAGAPPYRSLRDDEVDPPSYGSVVIEHDLPAMSADVTSAAHAPPPYSSVITDHSQRGAGKRSGNLDNVILDPPPAYPGSN